MAVRMIKIYLSLYTACGCITMSFACWSFFFPLPYADAESVRPAGLSYTAPSVQQLNPGWNDWYDDGRDSGGFLSKAAPIGLFTFLATRRLLEAAGSSSWSLPGLSKGCDLFVPFAKAVGVFPVFFFLPLLLSLKSELTHREKLWEMYSWKLKTKQCELSLFWMCWSDAGCVAAGQSWHCVALAVTFPPNRSAHSSTVGWRRKVLLHWFLFINVCFIAAWTHSGADAQHPPPQQKLSLASGQRKYIFIQICS